MQMMGSSLSICRCLQALAASRVTLVPPDRRVSQVSGHSYRHMNEVLAWYLGGVLSVQMMGSSLVICRCLQALAASWATPVLPVKRVSRVSGHSCHEMKRCVV